QDRHRTQSAHRRRGLHPSWQSRALQAWQRTAVDRIVSGPDPLPPLPTEPTEQVEHAYRVHIVTPARRRLWLHGLLFALTIFTTLVIGSRLQFDFNARLPAYAVDEDLFPWLWALREPRHLLLGIPFSLTLMSILTAHELGHY